MDLVVYMAAPLAACLVIVGIHAYLGLHVLARGVIFVDLALAQIAALGAAIAYLAGWDAHSPAAFAASLGATGAGAALFSLTRSRRGEVPQEAIIGITYVVAAAASVLALDRAPHGAEHLKAILVGQVLWVTWTQIGQLAAVYGVVGVFHWHYRRRFLSLSYERGNAETSRWWDFLFYASFGLVITLSVPVVGVLLVFSFLIVPAVCAVLLAGTLRTRLTVAWLVGVATSAVGCALSYILDTPTGATIVCAFGAVLAGLGLLRVARGPG